MAHKIVDLRNRRSVMRRVSAPQSPQREKGRRSPLRSRRRKMRFAILAVFAVLCGALVWGVHALSYHRQFSIQSVTIEGVERVPPEVVVAYVNSLLDDGKFHFVSRRNILLYPKKAIATAVAVNFPRVASAHVALKSPLATEMIVKITERKPFSKWCAEPKDGMQPSCYWMDEGGFVYAEVAPEELGANGYVFTKGLTQDGEWPIGGTFAPEHVPGILSMLRYADEAGFRPTGVSIENDEDFFVYLGGGYFVKASYGQDAAQLARNLKLILESAALRGTEANLEYIDLRFGNRVYYKLKGETEVPAE